MDLIMLLIFIVILKLIWLHLWNNTVENQGVSPMARNAEKYSRRENLAGDTVRGRSRPHQDENTSTTKSSSNRAPSSTVSEKAGPRRQSSRESKKPEL